MQLVFFNQVPYMQISDMIPEVNIIGRKVSVMSVNGAVGSGVFWDPSRGFRGRSTLRKFLGSKEHLNRLKIYLNVAKILTVQNYNTKKISVNGGKNIPPLKLRVKQVIYESKM